MVCLIFLCLVGRWLLVVGVFMFRWLLVVGVVLHAVLFVACWLLVVGVCFT